MNGAFSAIILIGVNSIALTLTVNYQVDLYLLAVYSLYCDSNMLSYRTNDFIKIFVACNCVAVIINNWFYLL